MWNKTNHLKCGAWHIPCAMQPPPLSRPESFLSCQIKAHYQSSRARRWQKTRDQTDETEEISFLVVLEAEVQDQCQHGWFLQGDTRGRCLPGSCVKLGVFCLYLHALWSLQDCIHTSSWTSIILDCREQLPKSADSLGTREMAWCLANNF